MKKRLFPFVGSTVIKPGADLTQIPAQLQGPGRAELKLTQIPAQLQGPGRAELKLKQLAWFAHKFANFHQDRYDTCTMVGEKMEMYHYKTPSKQ